MGGADLEQLEVVGHGVDDLDSEAAVAGHAQARQVHVRNGCAPDGLDLRAHARDIYFEKGRSGGQPWPSKKAAPGVLA